MRYIPTSKGLAFGPDDLHAVDIIPLLGTSLPPWERLWEELKRGLAWEEMPRKELRLLQRAYPRRRFKGWISPRETFAYRIVVPTDEPFLDALYAIEAKESEAPPEAQHLLAGIMGVFWVDHLGRRNRRQKESRLAACIHMARLIHMDGPVELPGRMNRKALEDMAQDFLAGLKATTNMVISPLGGLDKVRYWLIVGRQLWMPEILRGLTPLYENLYGQIQVLLWHAAQAYAHVAPRLEYAGVPLPRRVDMIHDLFVQAHLWASGDADEHVVGWTLQHPPEFWPVPEEWPWPHGERARAVARLLLEDARRHRVYAPRGVFVLRIPKGVPLYTWGVRALRVRVDEGGMWAQMVDAGGKGSVAVRWEPDVGVMGRSLLEGADALHVTLAALWRDMVTEGEAALPRQGRKGEGQVRGRGSGSRDRGRERPRRLPRRRRPLVLRGQRVWGEEEERQRIYRRAHMVAGHVRHLPPGYEASERAREAARKAGVLLPPGTTWVRPHVRGGAGVGEKGDVLTEERAVMCVGLMQLVGHFRE